MSGWPRMGREGMAAIAPDADPGLLDAAAELLAPLDRTLGGVDAEHAPAFTFTPVEGRRASRFTVPPPPASPVPSVPADLPWAPAADLAALVGARLVDPADVLAAYAERIERLQPDLNAFLTVTLDPTTRPRARGRLAGLPVGLKDLIDTAGIPTTCGSAVFHDRRPATDATVWRRLRAAGATLAGKLNTQEFAAGVTSDNDTFGAVRNPWDLDRMSGGSSGGSAAAVAAAMVAGALGTDTGGSVRIPAGCCGVVGLKPTYGLLPARGVYPLAWTLDSVGVLARTVRDAALLLDVAGATGCEPAARAGAVRGLAPLRVGVSRTWLDGIQPAVARSFDLALTALERQGATVVDVDLPDPDLLVAINRVIAYAEGSAQHERLLRGGALYGKAIRPRMEAGRYILAADYLTAQRLRTAACHAFATAWDEVDLLATPVLPCTAPPLGSTEVNLESRREPLGTALTRFTAPFNLTGTPAITVPCGHDKAGLPIGLQLAAPPRQEALLCFAAAAYEAVAPNERRIRDR